MPCPTSQHPSHWGGRCGALTWRPSYSGAHLCWVMAFSGRCSRPTTSTTTATAKLYQLPRIAPLTYVHTTHYTHPCCRGCPTPARVHCFRNDHRTPHSLDGLVATNANAGGDLREGSHISDRALRVRRHPTAEPHPTCAPATTTELARVVTFCPRSPYSPSTRTLGSKWRAKSDELDVI